VEKNNKQSNKKIIFGLKVRQLRLKNKLSFENLSNRSGMSISYLNEIEKGKKYPKDDKIHTLSKALGTNFNELVSLDLADGLAPVGELLKSNFLKELPLDLFGIELSKVVEIIANAPIRVGAFISTLVQMARNYALLEENFYLGAMRSYQELRYNYFEEIEEAVLEFVDLHKLPKDGSVKREILTNILKKEYKFDIVENGFDDFPELQGFYSVFIPKKKKLLLNSELSEIEKVFELGKELGYNALNLKGRTSSSSLLSVNSFDEVLNHFKVVYFSTALLINRDSFVKDVKAFFKKGKWNGKAFLGLMKKYNASPEMFFQRLTSIIPQYFGLQKLFFLEVSHKPAQNLFEIDKELHFNHQHHPHHNGLQEHYCRRWLSLSLLKDFQDLQQVGKYVGTMVGAQRSRYFGTDDEYLCITLARTATPTPDQNISVTIGLLINEELKEKIKFVNDPSITHREVNKTCERCAIENCSERAAPATVIEKRQHRKAIQESLKKLMEE
jgi:XRE family transcriptional regulator, fatty acid utilization regulator